MLHAVLLAGWLFAQSATTPTLYQQQHAQEELANCLAKRGANYPAHFCDTPTPAPSATPHATSTPTPAPVVTSQPVDDVLSPAPAAGESVCWLTSDNPDIGDPASGGIVYDGDGNPIPCDAVTPNEDAPADGPLPDPPTSTPVVVIQRVTVQAPASPPQVVYRQSAAQSTPVPEVVYVEVTPTATDTPAPSHSSTPQPSATPTSAPTMTPTPVPTPTAEPTAIVAAASINADPPSTPDSMTPESILGKVGLGGLALAIIGVVLWAVTAKGDRV